MWPGAWPGGGRNADEPGRGRGEADGGYEDLLLLSAAFPHVSRLPNLLSGSASNDDVVPIDDWRLDGRDVRLRRRLQYVSALSSFSAHSGPLLYLLTPSHDLKHDPPC